MPSLTLLRHAKSSWDDAVARDFDRPLNPRGHRAAIVVGRWMRREGLSFDYQVASPAARVIETLAGIGEGYGAPIEPVWDRRLYLASAESLLDVVHALPATVSHALMVGHNPGLEELALMLAAETPGNGLRDALALKYPTAAVATLSWSGSWADAARGVARLDRFVRPRDLATGLGPQD